MAQPKITNDLNVVANSNLEITYLDGDLNIIQKLDDEPNDVGGLTSAELKAKFDEAGNTIKTYLNETLIPELLAADATEAARAEAETGRETAEAARVEAETERASAETARQTAETARVAAETERETQEEARQTAEAFRASAETARASAETARGSAEATRERQEAARQTAEEARSRAETQRESFESLRASAEADRQERETERETAETARAAAETARVAAENARNVWEDYSNAKSYVPGNKVAHQGSSYVNVSACAGVVPTDTEHWLLIARKGEDGSGAGDMAKAVYDPASAVQNAGGIPAYVAAQNAAMTAHIASTANPHEVNAEQVGAVSYSGAQSLTDEQKAQARSNIGAQSSTWMPTASDVGAVPSSQKGAANGVATLGSDGKVPSAQLPAISAVSVYAATIGTIWTENTTTGVKTQTVPIIGVTAAQTATVDHSSASADGTADGYADFVEEENQYLTYITNGFAETVAGGIRFTIFGAANTVSIPITVEVV